MDVVAKMNCRKAVGFDHRSVGIIKKGGKAMIAWLVRVCNVIIMLSDKESA